MEEKLGKRKRQPVRRFEDEDFPTGQPRRKGSGLKRGQYANELGGYQDGIQVIARNDIVGDLGGQSHAGLVSLGQSPVKFFEAAGIGNVPSRRRTAATSQNKKCNCKNSKCLKLYCECFASGRYCDGCNCRDCHNNKDHEEVRQDAVVAILERNPNAFRPKVSIDEDTNDSTSLGIKHHKGCNCKKSWCLKKYCECFQAGVFCTDSCRCVGCKNYEGSPFKTGPQVQAHDSAGVSPISMMRQAPMQHTPLGSPLQLSPERRRSLRQSPEKNLPMKNMIHASLTPEQIRATTSICISEVIKPEVVKHVCTLLMLLVDENLETLYKTNPIIQKIMVGDDSVFSNTSQDTIDGFFQDIQEKYNQQKDIMDREFLSTVQKIGLAIQEKVKEKKEVFQMHQNTFYNTLLGSPYRSPQEHMQQMSMRLFSQTNDKGSPQVPFSFPNDEEKDR
jgi:hypothetical protein